MECRDQWTSHVGLSLCGEMELAWCFVTWNSCSVYCCYKALITIAGPFLFVILFLLLDLCIRNADRALL
jgi:hypothetical protein